MIERPWRSSSLAREYTASAPSPFNCATRDAIRVMFVSGRASYHFAAKDAAVVLGPALASLSQGEDRGGAQRCERPLQSRIDLSPIRTRIAAKIGSIAACPQCW